MPSPSTGQGHNSPVCKHKLLFQQDLCGIQDLTRENHPLTVTSGIRPLLGSGVSCLTPDKLLAHESQDLEPWEEKVSAWVVHHVAASPPAEAPKSLSIPCPAQQE